MIKITVLFLCLYLLACTSTYKAWTTEPLDYIEFISKDSVDVEEILKKSKEKYFCISKSEGKSCYVRRTDLDKVEIKLYKTSKAITTDLEKVIYVTGYVLVGLYMPYGFLNDDELNQGFGTHGGN